MPLPAGVDGLQAAEQPEPEEVVSEEKKKVAIMNDGAVDDEYREWPEPERFPVGILKSNSYVSGEESEAEQVGPASDDTKQEGKKGSRRGRRKLVPVWTLVRRFLWKCFTLFIPIQFRFAELWDIVMIIVGTVMAVAAGVVRLVHILFFGEVIDQFVFYDLATNPAIQSNSSANQTAYFCLESSSGQDITANLLLFVNTGDPDATLLREISHYSLYYLGLGGGFFIAAYLATILWNTSAYRQTRKMRIAFYHSILRQEIGWFDVTEANELSTRLAE